MPTSVIDHESIRNRSLRDPHCDAMGFACRSAKSQDPVPVFIELPSPDQAIPKRFAFGVKALNVVCVGVGHLASVMANMADKAISVAQVA